MSKYSLDKYRNIGIMAHIDAGKQQQLKGFYIILEKAIKLEKSMMAQQQWIGWNKNKRGITITSAATTCFWRDHRINIIDTLDT